MNRDESCFDRSIFELQCIYSVHLLGPTTSFMNSLSDVNSVRSARVAETDVLSHDNDALMSVTSRELH